MGSGRIVRFLFYGKDHELRCGDTIRLEHALTKRNLHSEEIYQSMISGGQEVSAFGFEGEGNDSTKFIISQRRQLGSAMCQQARG